MSSNHSNNDFIIWQQAIQNLLACSESLAAYTRFNIRGDGSTQPAVPSPIPVIIMQDHDIHLVGIYTADDYGGSAQSPFNEATLIDKLRASLTQSQPELFKYEHAVHIICDIKTAQEMQWFTEL